MPLIACALVFIGGILISLQEPRPYPWPSFWLTRNGEVIGGLMVLAGFGLAWWVWR